ncbi:MAG: hypothetical protein PUB85_04515, partial [Clostridia bacterium]|nr:hypothetical protein [Clostridia bacterium]
FCELSAFSDIRYKKPRKKAGARKTVSVSAVLPGLFLHILKPYDMIKQTDKLEFVGELYENKKGCCTAIRCGMAISF